MQTHRKLTLAFSILPCFSAVANELESGLEEVVVYGSYRSSIERALDTKRNADSIVDAVSAEDIGKFPTENVADALQLVSGVSISRSRGEGLFVSVRGLGPIFQATTLNGRNVAVNENVENSRQSGRQFRYDVLPSELVSAIEVVKSPTAAMDEGAIGGIVNLRTFRPLELGQVTFTGSAKANWQSLSGDTDPRASGLTNWVNEDNNFGVLAAVTYARRAVRQDRMMTFDWQLGRAQNGRVVDGLIPGVFNPRRTRPTLELEDRERIGFSTAWQWRPTENLDLNADFLYSKFTTRFDEFGIDIELDRGALSNQMVRGNSLVAGTLNNTRLQASRETSEQEHENYVLGLNAEWTQDEWTVIGDIAYSEAESETIDPIRRNRLRVSGARVDFDFSGGSGRVPDLAMPNTDISRLASFPGRRIEYRPIVSVDDDFSLQLDVERALQSAITSVEFGLKYRARTRDYDRRDIRVSDGIAGVTFTDPQFSGRFPDNNFLSGQSGNFPRTFVVPSDTAFFNAFFDTPSLLARPLTTGDLRNSYDIEETIQSAYVKANLVADIGVPVTGNIGLRMAKTGQTAAGHGQLGGAAVPVSFEKDYTDYLPSLNLLFELREDLLLRTSASRVITRPSLADIAPRLTFGTDINDADGGNPRLDPYRANQYDASLEWYFSEASAVSFAVFHKDIGNFVTNSITTIAGPAGTAFPTYNLSSRVNGGEVKISGIELSYQQIYDFLPAPFDGLGFQANYTHASDETSANVGTSVEGLSNNSLNMLLFYETGSYSARLSYNWRDDFVASAGNARQPSRVEDAFGLLDMSLSYAVNDSLSVTLEATNLTNAAQEIYAGTPDRFQELNYWGRRVVLGVKLKM